MDQAKAEICWFDDGKLNAAYNAIDKHLLTPTKDQIALYWEGQEGDKKTYTFAQMAAYSNRWGIISKQKDS